MESVERTLDKMIEVLIFTIDHYFVNIECNYCMQKAQAQVVEDLGPINSNNSY